jgi:hypothetical protein
VSLAIVLRDRETAGLNEATLPRRANGCYDF